VVGRARGIPGYLPKRLRWDLQARWVHDGWASGILSLWLLHSMARAVGHHLCALWSSVADPLPVVDAES